jgi:hypothetical protein
MTVDDFEMTLAGELVPWKVILTDSSSVVIFAHAYSENEENVEFSILVKGTPYIDVPIAIVPSSVVSSITSE